MTKKYDLHCHSTASDGVLTPTELVQRAHEQGVNVLALCDHDTVMGIDEAKIEADKLGIELINGVEISTNWEGRGIHIVGLNFDKTHPKMTALLAEQKSLREKRAVEIGHKLEKAGIPNAYEGAKALANGEVTRAHYMRYNMTGKWIRRLIVDFKQWGGDGMEVADSGQTKDQRQYLARLANEYDLAASLGSDFHFPCGWIELGKNLFLPEEVKPIWTLFE